MNRMYFPEKNETELNALAEKWLVIDEGLTMDEYFEKYASEETRQLMKEFREEQEKTEKQGEFA